jgi:hypothetical protein
VPCLSATAYSSLLVKIIQQHQTVVGMSSALGNYQLDYPKLLPRASTADSTIDVLIIPTNFYDPETKNSYQKCH